MKGKSVIVTDRSGAIGGGSTVNITSNSALSPAAGNHLANCAGAKGYVMVFPKALAYEWGLLGIRINYISPGWTPPWQPKHVGQGSAWQ